MGGGRGGRDGERERGRERGGGGGKKEVEANSLSGGAAQRKRHFQARQIILEQHRVCRLRVGFRV